MNSNEGISIVEELFSSPERGGLTAAKEFRLIRRCNRILLALPPERGEMALGLELYPAQRRMARRLKWGLQAAARGHLPLPFEDVSCRIATDSGFSRFLTGLAPNWAERRRGLAVLAGNPEAAGRRFVFLLFHNGAPKMVVKAGCGSAAQELVRREREFRERGRRFGIELPLSFDSESLAAFAIPFAEGNPPNPGDLQKLPPLMESWLTDEVRELTDLPPWVRLSAALRGEPHFGKVHAALESHEVRVALMHGDFAPWNIKVHPRTAAWEILDWERGEERGIPGWDWLHFEIQAAILVRGEKPERILQRLEQLFETPDFRRYAARAGIAGIERPLTIAYLMYCETVQRQSEGKMQIKALGNLIDKTWNV